LARRLYYGVRYKIRPATKQIPESDEFAEDQLPPDESREIEAPPHASEELQQLWDGTLDPFTFLEKHRGKKIKEIDYQILTKHTEGKTSAQIGAELGLTAENVRYRYMEVLKKIRG
jgi:DNA-binding NarL/FixJ family response regulator